MEVKIDIQLFDEIEAYLQSRAAAEDGEATRLLMHLEDTEIQRTAQEYQLDGSEAVTQIHADGIINPLKGFES